MPYISEEQRKKLIPKCESYPTSSGDLNFQITCLVLEYIKYNGSSYKQMNDVVGALESAKLEFYRRLVSPYEDKKIKDNGDVY